MPLRINFDRKTVNCPCTLCTVGRKLSKWFSRKPQNNPIHTYVVNWLRPLNIVNLYHDLSSLDHISDLYTVSDLTLHMTMLL